MRKETKPPNNLWDRFQDTGRMEEGEKGTETDRNFELKSFLMRERKVSRPGL